MSYLLDTDICSAYLKGDRKVWNKLMQYSGRLHISAVTSAELFVWALRAKASPSRMAGILDLFDDVKLLEVDQIVAQQFGEIRAFQLDNGHFTPQMDLLIAATAVAHGLTLVSHNLQDFANVPNLTTEDWLAP